MSSVTCPPASAPRLEARFEETVLPYLGDAYRLARWLLMTHERMDGDKLGLTHEFISLMLGVRRAGVTSALQGFEAKGLIERARSTVVVKDRAGLVEAANGLYGPPEAEFERLFA